MRRRNVPPKFANFSDRVPSKPALLKLISTTRSRLKISSGIGPPMPVPPNRSSDRKLIWPIDVGMDPVIPILPSKCNRSKLLMEKNSSGMGPASLLEDNASVPRLPYWVNSLGTSPTKLLPLRINCDSVDVFPRELGILPSNWLSANSRSSSGDSLKKSVGKVPSKLFPCKTTRRKLVILNPKFSGMEPPTSLLMKANSSSSCHRLISGGRVPVSPLPFIFAGRHAEKNAVR
jgi:hypothetical protein